jgi:hypothetical protein
MSKKTGLDLININNHSGRIARMELINHPRFMLELTGLDPFDDLPACEAEMYRRLDQDLMLGINFLTPPKVFRNENQITTKNEEGETISQWGVYGTTFKIPIPLAGPDEILAFKPLERNDWLNDIPRRQIENWRDSSRLVGDASLVTLNFWTTLLHWGTQFPWESYMMAAYQDPVKFDRLLDDLAAVSEHIMTEFARTDAPVVMCHDDLAMGDRTLFSPAWTREKIIARYPRIFRPIKKKGKKILFISDGDITEIVGDLIEAGVDGFLFEPMVNLEWMVKKFGYKVMLIGNADSKILTNGTTDQCRAETDRCARQAGHCGGYAFCASGGIVHNVPMENVKAYLGQQEKYRTKK